MRRYFASAARILAAASLAVPLAALGGCGMSSLTSGLGGGMFGGSSENTQVSSVSEDQLLDAAKSGDPSATGSTFVGEVDAGCPRLIIAPHDNYITFYEVGHVGDALAVAQRGEITKTARECQIEPGRVTVKYGFSGRLLLGPKGQPGSVTLPITVAVNDSKRTQDHDRQREGRRQRRPRQADQLFLGRPDRDVPDCRRHRVPANTSSSSVSTARRRVPADGRTSFQIGTTRMTTKKAKRELGLLNFWLMESVAA